MSVLREGRMIGDMPVEPKPAKPSICQIEVDFLAQPPLRSNAEAIAHDQHSDHQLWINRWPANRAAECRQFPSHILQLDEPVDGAQQMISWNVPLWRKLIEQRSLFDLPMSHHDSQSCF